MTQNMNSDLHCLDELMSALRTSGEETVDSHLSDDECIAYADGRLSPHELEAIDSHLAVCPRCASRLNHLVEESRFWLTPAGKEHIEKFRNTLLAAASDNNIDKRESSTDVSGEGAYASRAHLRLRTRAELDVLKLLEDVGAIEREYDYVLPCGLHCDTYINTSKLCRSENGLSTIAAACDALFCDLLFDVILCSGWATAMIARRMARERSIRFGRPIRVVIAEGYESPTFTEDILPNSRVLVLLDVSITGRLSERLRAGLRHYDAILTGIGCIVTNSDAALARPAIRALAVVDMQINDPTQEMCPRCARLRKLVFNPVSSQMTVKKLVPRSPTQFLEEFPDAGSFWESVNLARAYEHHHVERDVHYLAFVNTMRLLQHPTVGPRVVGDLLKTMIANDIRPRVCLVPKRSRARVLASQLAAAFAELPNGKAATIVVARQRHGVWSVTEEDRQRICGADTLIVDSAAGHGCILDELALLASRARARSVSAAILLSRLSLSCEDALRERLQGRFFRLFHLPIRPVAIRTNDRSLCPVCHQRQLLQDAAAENGKEALVKLAELVSQKTKRPKSSEDDPKQGNRPIQRLLFDREELPLLERCTRSVASGITLHALHTAMTDGMAPLSLPELVDSHIPRENRVAMLENLPAGVFEWSDAFLDQSVEHVLAGVDERIWLASADALAREGRTHWVAYLTELVQHSAHLQSKPCATFWNRLAYSMFRLSSQDADLRDEIKEIVNRLIGEYGESNPGDGLRRVYDAVSE